MYKFSSFQKENNSNKILGKNLTINDCYLRGSTIFTIQKYNLQFGLDIQNMRQIIIVSFLTKKTCKTKKHINNNLPFCLVPIWTGIEDNKTEKYNIEIFQRKGCSIQQYLSSLQKVKAIHLHFILKQLIFFLQKMYQKNINFKLLNFSTLYMHSTDNNDRRCQLQILNLDVIKQAQDLVSKDLQNQTIEHLSSLSHKKKKVLFHINFEEQKHNLKRDLQMIVRKFHNVIKRLENNISKKQRDQLNTLKVILNKIAQHCINNCDSTSYTKQTLKIFLRIQSTLIKNSEIEKAQYEALSINKKIINHSKKRIQRTMNSMSLDEGRNSQCSQGNQDQIENEFNQKICQYMQSHTIKMRQNCISKFQQEQLCEIPYSLSIGNKNIENNLLLNSLNFVGTQSQYKIKQRYSHPLKHA